MLQIRQRHGFWPAALVAFIAAALPVACSPMAAWYANEGVQFVMQGEDDYLYYSYCNASFDIGFPTDQSLKLPVSAKPRKNTPITGVGWYDEQGETSWACVWYFDSFDDLIYKRYRCDPETGEFETKDEQILTDEIPVDVQANKQSGLAAVLLGATDGIRLYFHDAQDALHSLMFSNDRGWGYEQLINPDQAISGKAIGAVNRITKGNEITLITPKDSQNMEECSLNRDELWYIDTFPNKLTAYNVTNLSPEQQYQVSALGTQTNATELVGWDGQPGNIGVALGEDYRSMFYIGTDKKLHKLSSFPPSINNTKDTEDDYINKGNWQAEPAQDAKYWPVADEANAHFAMAGWLDDNGAHVHIYYMANGTLTRALFENSTWFEAEAVPTDPPVSPEKGGSGNGLSDGAKAGIGVGAFVGAAIIAALVGACCMWRRRKQIRREQEHRDREATAALFAGGQAPPYQRDMYRPYSPYDHHHHHHHVPQQHGHFTVQGQQFHYVPSVSPEPSEYNKSEMTASAYPSELPEHGVSSYEMMGEGHFREMATPATTIGNTLDAPSPRYQVSPSGEPSPSSDAGEMPRRR